MTDIRTFAGGSLLAPPAPIELDTLPKSQYSPVTLPKVRPSPYVCVRERERAPNTLHPTPYTLHPASYTMHHTSYTIHPALYTLPKSQYSPVTLPKVRPSPTPHTRHPTHYTLHTSPYTLHPTPCTPHPTPHTLHPTPLSPVIDSALVVSTHVSFITLGGVPRAHKMLKGHLPRVIYHQGR